MRTRWDKRWFWGLGVPLACALLLAGDRCVAQESGAPAAEQASGEETAAETAPETPMVAVKKFRGRLPAYYSAVVTSEQRQAIYDIQAVYFEKLQALEKQIAELKTKQDEEVEAVLRPEQLEEVAKLRQAAAERRKRRSAPADETAASGEG
jgi:hypothetical protein